MLARFAIGNGRSMVLCLADELDDVFESLTKRKFKWSKAIGASSMFLKAFLKSLSHSWVSYATNDEFELIGGISFHKGCYPGQEVVARAQY